jgi:uncharacterized membrane protein YccC
MPTTTQGWQRWSGELRLALRTTLAGLITFGLGLGLGLPQAYWAVLTSVIVVQASVATSLKAGADRMLGTVAGAVWGVIVTLTIPHQQLAPHLTDLAERIAEHATSAGQASFAERESPS